MRLVVVILALGLLGPLTAGEAAASGSAAGPSDQGAPDLFVFADVVVGAPAPVSCVAQSRFAPGERIVFRVRVIDPQTGEMARDAVVAVQFADGRVLPMVLGPHPARGTPTDEFWAASWEVPEDAPLGVIQYTVTAVQGERQGRFQPFNVESSLLTIVPRS